MRIIRELHVMNGRIALPGNGIESKMTRGSLAALASTLCLHRIQ